MMVICSMHCPVSSTNSYRDRVVSIVNRLLIVFKSKRLPWSHVFCVLSLKYCTPREINVARARFGGIGAGIECYVLEAVDGSDGILLE